MTSNDLQNTTETTKDRAIRTQLKTRVNSVAPEGKVVPAPPLVTPVLLLLLQIR